MRGSNTLFADIFEEEFVPVPSSKGRSATLHQLRNEALVARYYFYGKFTDKRYVAIIQTLSNEFWLSKATISELIGECFDYLIKLKKQQPERKWFQQQWPHLSWS